MYITFHQNHHMQTIGVHGTMRYHCMHIRGVHGTMWYHCMHIRGVHGTMWYQDEPEVCYFSGNVISLYEYHQCLNETVMIVITLCAYHWCSGTVWLIGQTGWDFSSSKHDSHNLQVIMYSRYCNFKQVQIYVKSSKTEMLMFEFYTVDNL